MADNLFRDNPAPARLADGWAHHENVMTDGGMLRELAGMLGGDRHERAMAAFERQRLEEWLRALART